jgi:hypothetical protein
MPRDPHSKLSRCAQQERAFPDLVAPKLRRLLSLDHVWRAPTTGMRRSRPWGLVCLAQMIGAFLPQPPFRAFHTSRATSGTGLWAVAPGGGGVQHKSPFSRVAVVGPPGSGQTTFAE